MPTPPRATALRPPADVCRALEAIEAESAHVQHLAAAETDTRRLGLRTERYGSGTAIVMRKSRNLIYNRLIGRRQGAQGALIRRRVSDGRRLGCELFAVETAPPLPRMPLVSFRNLCQRGFHLAYLCESWRLQLR